MGRVMLRIFVVVCLLIAIFLPVASGVAEAAAPFSDVPSSDPAYTAINELASRGIIKGCDPAAGRFCPNDATLRAQMAALIARAMQWDGEDHGNQFADRCDPGLGCIDNDLWRNVGTLQFYGVARGFDATSYGPHNAVLQQQVLLFISRAMVKKGAWQRQPDNASIYPNLPRGNAAQQLDAQDIVTYVAYVGAAPDTQSGTAWSSYTQASTRAWFARALWQVLARFPVGPAPSTPPVNGSPTLGVSPAAGPAGTQFVVSATGAPAGATIGWAFNFGGVQANTGSFTLDPGTTAFTFTANTTGSPAGEWALSFKANGQAFGTVFFTVTSAPASPEAAQFKARVIAAVNQAYPAVEKVATECPGTGPLYCTAIYNQSEDAIFTAMDTVLYSSSPLQCQSLHYDVLTALRNARDWLGDDYTRTSAGWINGGDASYRAFEAIKWLNAIKYTVENSPGSCR